MIAPIVASEEVSRNGQTRHHKQNGVAELQYDESVGVKQRVLTRSAVGDRPGRVTEVSDDRQMPTISDRFYYIRCTLL